MVESMKDGSVVVDLAAEMGGNCKLTEKDKVVVKHGVKLIGYTDLPSRLAAQASQLYATNLRHLLTDMTPEKDGLLQIDMEDEVIRGCTVIKQGEVTWPPPAPRLYAVPEKEKDKEERAATVPASEKPNPIKQLLGFGFLWCSVVVIRLGCASRFHVSFHSVCLVMFYWLHGDLECFSIFAYTIDECD